MKILRISLACCQLAGLLLQAAPLRLAEGPEVQSALQHISVDSLRGNLSFLASDALEGRESPSRGLDIAAEFIASQFRRAGLEAPVADSYFQTADFLQLTRRTEGLSVVLAKGEETLRLDSEQVTVTRTNAPLKVDALTIFKLSGDTVPDEVAGKAVLIPARSSSKILRILREKKAALALIQRTGRRGGDRPVRELVAVDLEDAPAIPVVGVRGDAAKKLVESLPDGATGATLTVRAPGPQREAVKLRNVIGILRGSDPQLKDTYILVTAHYDHLGMKAPDGEADSGDRVYNGANDDGSGVVSVIELASALASMSPHPRRSIVFMTVFGEEKGLLGSQYYGRHPVVPLAKTVADINIEQVGRTDDNEKPQVAAATMTGFTYSELPELFVQAGKATGVQLYDRNPGDDPFFARSDNQALADAGVPSHTVAVSLEFPDYHQLGDEWHKIDYTNMAMIDRMLGQGIISLANDPEPPKWNELNQNTQKYVAAWKKLHGAPNN